MWYRLSLLRRWVVPAMLLGLLATAIVVWPGRGTGLSGAGGVWTCSMHPQIRMDHFDRCPICGMDLVPVANLSTADAGQAATRPDQLFLSRQAALSARVGTVKVEARALFRDIRTVGKIDFDETRMAQIASRVSGRVEQVFADFPGTVVKKGDHLVGIYSPDLVSTQEEFLVASRREQDAKGTLGSNLAASARRRLVLWGISDEQINQILASGKAQTLLTVYAPLGGTVIQKMVRAGQYVKEGETLYTIADLNHVWLLVEVYEPDLAWVRFGQSVQVTLEADPAASFTGQIGFVEPVLNEQTRTVRVRVILKNEERKMRPGMFAQALIRVPIMPDGTPAPTGLEGKFACPMHPYVVQDEAANCRVCEMALEKIPGTPLDLKNPPTVLAIPADAVLTTGRRQLVYIDRGEGVYQLVEPHLGPRAGDYFPVLHGLQEGDLVVARGSFLMDSQFQISGKPSLLYPEGMSGGGHAGHAETAANTGANTGAKSEVDASDMAKIQLNLGKLTASDQQLALRQAKCPVTGLRLGVMGVPMKLDVDGQPVFVCCAGCTSVVRQDPRGIREKLSLPNAPAGTSKSTD